jgi:cysteine-rich repeat protein
MRTDNRSLVLATLGGLCTAMACTLITDVDRQKITTPTGNEGGQGASGGTAGTGGKGGGAGSSGSSGAGQGGEAGEGATGGTGNAGSGNGGTGNAGSGNGGTGNAGTGNAGSGGTAGTDEPGGAGGESGAPAQCGNGTTEAGEACDDGNVASCGTCAADCSAVRVIPTDADASLTIGAGTNIADGDTITINDGSDTAVFEFECDPLSDCPNATNGVGSGNVPVLFNATNFDGVDDAIEYRDLLIAAIDGSSLTTDAEAAGLTPVVALTGVETLSDTVGAPTFVAAVRCRTNRTCAGDSVCLSNSCTAGSCD